LTKKAKLKVLGIEEKGDTWYVTVDTNEEGRRILMQAGIDQALNNMVDNNYKILSWWGRFKYAWRTAK
jgi:predicted RNA-binding protein (virulence factor B family)